MKHTVFVVGMGFGLVIAALGGCAEEEEVEGACAGGQRSGVQGQVMVASCSDPVFFADVTLFNELQFEVASTQADAEGRFSFPASALPGDGVFILTARSGPLRGPARPAPFSVEAGCSAFQTVKMATD